MSVNVSPPCRSESQWSPVRCARPKQGSVEIEIVPCPESSALFCLEVEWRAAPWSQTRRLDLQNSKINSNLRSVVGLNWPDIMESLVIWADDLVREGPLHR